jgi:hypothetical protein
MKILSLMVLAISATTLLTADYAQPSCPYGNCPYQQQGQSNSYQGASSQDYYRSPQSYNNNQNTYYQNNQVQSQYYSNPNQTYSPYN